MHRHGRFPFAAAVEEHLQAPAHGKTAAFTDPETEGVHMSLYLRRTQRRAMLVIANLNRKPADRVVVLDCARVGLPPDGKVVSEDGEATTMRAGRIAVRLAPQSLRVWCVECSR